MSDRDPQAITEMSKLTVDKLAAEIAKAITDKQIQASAKQLGNQICQENGVKSAVAVISSTVRT